MLSGDPANENDQRGGRTHYDRVDKRAQHGDQTLAYWLIRAGCGMRYRRRTETGLVGESSPLNSDQHGAQEAADAGLWRERLRKDAPEHTRNLRSVDEQRYNGSANVEQAHHRHDFARHLTDSPDAADDDHPHAHHQEQPRHPHRDLIDLVHHRGRLIGLEHVPAAKAAQSDEHREQPSQRSPAAAHAHLHVVHRATADGAVFANVPVEDGQGAGDELGGHTEEPSHPHPKHGASAARGHGHRHAGDIAQADGGAQSCGQSLEVSELAFVFWTVEFAAHYIDRMPKTAQLNTAVGQSEDDAGAY